ncbi:hypothetical protein SGPA1_12253 [Streptomyces misionensis JCM 4497]
MRRRRCERAVVRPCHGLFRGIFGQFLGRPGQEPRKGAERGRVEEAGRHRGRTARVRRRTGQAGRDQAGHHRQCGLPPPDTGAQRAPARRRAGQRRPARHREGAEAAREQADVPGRPGRGRVRGRAAEVPGPGRHHGDARLVRRRRRRAGPEGGVGRGEGVRGRLHRPTGRQQGELHQGDRGEGRGRRRRLGGVRRVQQDGRGDGPGLRRGRPARHHPVRLLHGEPGLDDGQEGVRGDAGRGEGPGGQAQVT